MEIDQKGTLNTWHIFTHVTREWDLGSVPGKEMGNPSILGHRSSGESDNILLNLRTKDKAMRRGTDPLYHSTSFFFFKINLVMYFLNKRYTYIHTKCINIQKL